MDLLQGHYMTSVNRDMAVPSKAGLIESYAVGTIIYSLSLQFTYGVITLRTNVVFLSQSFRLAFALVMGVLMFMMMSLRQGKNSESAETDILGVFCYCNLAGNNICFLFFDPT